jgi:hypothetical protein
MNAMHAVPQTAADGANGGIEEAEHGPVAPQEGTDEDATGGRSDADEGGVSEPGEGPVAPQEGTQE